MNRREVLKYSAYAFGTMLSAPITQAILSGTVERIINAKKSNELKFFSPGQFNLLTAVIDAILPKTESPSASEVGVGETIDSVVAEVYDESRQRQFSSNFLALQNYLASSRFLESTSEEKLQILQLLLDSENNSAEFWGLRSLRDMSISFYLSSEKIGEEFLTYLPVPGPYRGCIDVSEVNNVRYSI